jgi:hypothetical protein
MVARNTVISTIANLLEGRRQVFGSRSFKWLYNATYHEFRIMFRGRTGVIIVYSGENPLSLRGPNLAAAVIDEPFIQDVEVFNQMIARVRHPHARRMEIGLTGTPEQLNWGYDLCIGELSERHDVAYVQVSTRQNQALAPSYVERLLGSLPGKAAQAYIDGGFVNLATGLVYYAFDPFENVVDLHMTDGVQLGCGMDFNVNPMSACVFWRAGRHIHYFDEIELPNADTEYMCNYLRDQYGDRLQDIYPDATGSARKTAAPAGKTDFWYIRHAGFTVHAPHENPKRKDRYNAVNAKMKPANGQVSLTVSKKCKKLQQYLQTYSHELMNKQEQMSHLLDAFSYPIAYLFPADGVALRKVAIQGY